MFLKKGKCSTLGGPWRFRTGTETAECRLCPNFPACILNESPEEFHRRAFRTAPLQRSPGPLTKSGEKKKTNLKMCASSTDSGLLLQTQAQITFNTTEKEAQASRRPPLNSVTEVGVKSFDPFCRPSAACCDGVLAAAPPKGSFCGFHILFIKSCFDVW